MALVLSILRCPETVSPERRRVTGGEYALGRGSENEWPLADPERVLSKRHCVIAFRAGSWQVADISTNGTFLNREEEPIGRGGVRELRGGDRLRLGPYEFEVQVEPEAQAAPWGSPGTHAAAPPGPPAFGASPFGGSAFGSDPFGDDPLAPPRGGADPFGGDPLVAPGPRDPFAADPPGQKGPAANPIALGHEFGPPTPAPPPFRQATDPDHLPAFEQAFRPPTPTPPALPPDLDDWDLDLNPKPPTPPAAPIVPPTANPAPASPPPGPPAPAPADPFADLPPLGGPAAPASPVPAAPPLCAAPPASPDDLLAAFMRGAGMEAAGVADPAATMAALGAAFRELVCGLRQALMARAAVKGEFRIEQTMIRARGNNPLKFSADDDDALAALLGTGRHVEMAPAAAVADALRDMRLHELASVAAMQAAVRSLVARLDPEPLRAEAERSGGVLPASRRARAFELYEKLHASVTQGLADDFESVFGRAFARAYEEALRDADERKRS
ncbi:MAG: type VI secretion system-associated FHA domain protein TagH [Rhodospirillales bacterium]|nr:type VI secretion system-associated FHA domain protein TagH [Rhodospirillales bacterium]